MFDKKEVLKQIVVELEKNLEVLIHAAREARDAATHEDAKAENKYDTRGLEASYLAGAQARRAKDLQDAIDAIRQMDLKNFMDTTPIAASALVQLEVDQEQEKWFFILPSQGGIKVQVDDEWIQVISPQSPIGKSIVGQVVGHEFAVNNKEFEVKEVW